MVLFWVVLFQNPGKSVSTMVLIRIEIFRFYADNTKINRPLQIVKTLIYQALLLSPKTETLQSNRHFMASNLRADKAFQ